MSQIPNVNNFTANEPFGDSNSLNDLDTSDFLDLMIAELQNQDPLNPLENDELIAQIGQIREIGATDDLSATLESMTLSQNVTSATNLIGSQVSGVSDENNRVVGTVSRVSISNGVPKLEIDNTPVITGSSEEGEIEAGTYSYRVVWDDGLGNPIGVEFPDPASGEPFVTAGTSGEDQSILLANLPESDTAKQVYRTDKTGQGQYRLVGTIPDGKQSTYVDGTSDANRSNSVLSRVPSLLQQPRRTFTVGMDNVGEIRPPAG
ncbi:MAG: flagellar hook capping FlgD N-terminal domain-containing protein [Planctomycetota bacterium]